MIHHKDFPFDSEDREIIHVTKAPVWQHHKWKILILAFLIASLMFFGKYLYDLGRGSTNPLNAPLVTATAQPYKVKPEEPGGMVIPHMDKEIFDSIDENITQEIDNENIKPIDSYEKPITAQDDDEIAKLIKKTDDSYKKPVVKKAATIKPKTIKLDGSSNYKKPTIKSANSKKIDVDKVLARQQAPQIWVQLGTYNSEAAATNSWQEVSEKNIDVLSGNNIKISKSFLGDNGTFYRLQSGPFSSEAEAKELCKKLNAREQNCFPIKPTKN